MQLSPIKHLCFLFVLACSSTVSANSLLDLKEEEVAFSYWNEATPPFAFVEGKALTGGIIKDIGDAIAQRLKLTPHFVKLPVVRIEQ